MFRLIVLSAIVAVAFGVPAYNGNPREARILKLDSDISPDGAYQFAYETENGIQAQAQGSIKQVGTELAENVQGSASWETPEGEKVSLQYVADENGYQPVGSHLPTSPPIPDAIARALQYIEQHPAAPDAPGQYSGVSGVRGA